MLNTLKQHKLKAVISSLITLLPMFFGLMIWNSLPESINIHWGADGAADGTGSRAFTVFALPLITLALHWLCLILTMADPGNREQSKKAMSLIFWIVPTISLMVSIIVYGSAMGRDMSMENLLPAVTGIMFIVFGNYMPKISRNSTLGIKVPWALNDDENWRLTHRLGGRLWLAGGFALLFAMLLPEKIMAPVTVAVISVVAVVPIIYSYAIYKKQLRGGTYNKSSIKKAGKPAASAGLIITVLILLGVAVLLFTGDIEFKAGDSSLEIKASYYGGLTLDYADIDSIELRTDGVDGMRTNGYGSPRLAMGTFSNSEFGRYTRYTYTGESVCIVLHSGDKVLVIADRDETATRELYGELLKYMGK